MGVFKLWVLELAMVCCWRWSCLFGWWWLRGWFLGSVYLFVYSFGLRTTIDIDVDCDVSCFFERRVFATAVLVSAYGVRYVSDREEASAVLGRGML